MKKAILIVLMSVVLALPIPAESAHANPAPASPNRFDIAPVLLTGDQFSEFSVGLEYDFFYQRRNLWDIRLGEAESLLQFNLNGALAADEDLNKKSLVSEALAGFSLLGGHARKDTFDPGNPDADPGGARDIGNWGYIFAGLDARFEATQDLDEQNLAAGIQLGYINPRDEGIYTFIPSVILAYEVVDRTDSDIDTDDYARFRIEASLKSSFGRNYLKDSALAPLGLRLDARYYQSSGMTDRLTSADQDQVTYLAAALTYSPDIQIFKARRPTFFVQLADGRIPPTTDDETTVTIGVIVHLFGR